MSLLGIRRLDLHILTRFLVDFVLLFAMLFAFATLIDAVLRLEEFRKSTALLMGPGAEPRWFDVLATIATFHGPRVFQFYQYLFGLVAVAAAGFTVARMQKDRELIAMLAAGIPLQRAALPILVGFALLSAGQVVNQEVVLPSLAARLRADLPTYLKAKEWAVPLEVDRSGNLIRAAAFDPVAGTLEQLIIYQRTPDGQIARRIASPRAVWSEAQSAWLLEGGRADERSGAGAGAGQNAKAPSASVTAFVTDLGPDALSLRGDAVNSHLISTARLREMRMEGAIAASPYRHLVGSRFAVLVVNLALLCISLPFLLRREPGGLLQPAIRSAAIMVPLGIIALGALAVPNPWLGTTVGLMLPIAVLVPAAVWRLSAMET